tara:strand:+ start:1216 stop:1800 length:585 start_codon:yes stop_codon:yes gene_type:complete
VKNILLVLITTFLILSSCKKEKVEEVLPCLCETNDNSFVEYLNNDSSESLICYIPNSFTPNGDQHNDNFYIRINSFADSIDIDPWNDPVIENISYNLFIEGNQVVFDDPVNGPTFPWNAAGYSNGEYTYLITFSYNGLTYQKNGKFSLIKDINNLSNTFNCFPEGLSNCTFPDMIDPEYGFIYPTQEDIGNWPQ